MKRIVLLTTLLALTAVLGVGAANVFADEQGHKNHKMHGDMSKEVTLVGEVLDLYCYMKHPANGQGAEHAKCAKNCIKKGLPIGFLSDGDVYLIIGKDHESASDMVVEFAGMQAQLTGTLVMHDGVKALEINTISKIAATSGSAK
jgi:hypothetical protein